MPFCANCGASTEEPVETCANCAPAPPALRDQPALPAPPAAIAAPAVASGGGKVLAGCLALIGGVMAGTTASTICFWLIAGAVMGAGKAGNGAAAKVASIVVLASAFAGLISIVRSNKARDPFLHLFLITTLVTALGVFGICSSLFFTGAMK